MARSSVSRKLRLALAFILGLTPTLAWSAEWKVVQPENAGFSCEMPGEAKVMNQKVDTVAGPIEVVIYSSELDEAVYLINSVTIPANAPAANAEQRLDGARDGAVANVRGKLIDEKKIKFGEHPGRQLLIEQPSGLVIHARIYIVEKRLIQNLVVSKSKTVTKEMTKFFDSLKLVKKT